MTEEARVAWLREQITAREERAKAAAGPVWFLDSTEDDDERSIRYTGPSTLHAGALADYYIADRVDEHDAAHIAANDPQQVIADCEMQLAILDEHGTRMERAGGPLRDCQWREWPCPTIRLVASAYRHKPGYAEHWDGT